MNYVLMRVMFGAEKLMTCLTGSLEDLAEDKSLELERTVEAKDFNAVGEAILNAVSSKLSLRSFLWWLLCIVEAQSAYRIWQSSMEELLRRTVDLLNEAYSRLTASKNYIM